MSATTQEQMDAYQGWVVDIREGELRFTWCLAMKVAGGRVGLADLGMPESELRQALIRRFEQMLVTAEKFRDYPSGDQHQEGMGAFCTLCANLLITSDWPEPMRITREDVELDDARIEALKKDYRQHANRKVRLLQSA